MGEAKSGALWNPRTFAGFLLQEITMAKNPDDKDQTLPKSQGEKEKPDRPGKGSKPQNQADRP